MGTVAEGRFDIDSWDEEPYDEKDGIKLTRTRVTKSFLGDMEGKSTAELLMAYAQEGSAAYVGFERIVGSVSGKEGSFLLHHSATATSEHQFATWTIVPNSGTGGLTGIKGSVEIGKDAAGKHTFVLNYDIV